MADRKSLAERLKEAVERGWVTVGTELDNPKIFKFRPAGNERGRAFTDLEAFLDGYETVSESKLRNAQADADHVILKAQQKLAYAENFWGGDEGLQWYCRLYNVTEQDVLQAMKKD